MCHSWPNWIKSCINLEWIEKDLILNETISILSGKLLQMTFKKERGEHSPIIIGTFVFKIGFTTSVLSNAWKCQAWNQKCGRDLHWIPGVMNEIPLTAWEGLDGGACWGHGGCKVKAGLVSASHGPMDEKGWEILWDLFLMKCDVHHEKTDLKVFVVVIPKEGWARPLWVWHRL